MEPKSIKKTDPGSEVRVISSACILCGNCIQVCPTESIFLGKKQYVIDSDTCDGYGLCAKVCPVNAIYKLGAFESGTK